MTWRVEGDTKCLFWECGLFMFGFEICDLEVKSDRAILVCPDLGLRSALNKGLSL